MSGAFPYQIDRGVPVPPPLPWQGAGRPPKADWSVLQVGDSCLVPSRSAARTAYTYMYTHPGTVFRVHKRGLDDDERGWRVWRVR